MSAFQVPGTICVFPLEHAVRVATVLRPIQREKVSFSMELILIGMLGSSAHLLCLKVTAVNVVGCAFLWSAIHFISVADYLRGIMDSCGPLVTVQRPIQRENIRIDVRSSGGE